MPALSGGKWGGTANGSSGGVVTWSLIGAGKTGVIEAFGTTGFGFRDDKTTNGQSVTGFNVFTALQGAFQSWEAVADIEFVQVADGGERVIGGHSADIRIAFGYIDGEDGRVLGKAFFAPQSSSKRAGDILFDDEEFGAAFLEDKFVAVAAHEIGHAIGLRHVNDTAALMNPVVGEHTAPQPDDIQGARQIYGRPRETIKRLELDEDMPDVRIVERKDGLRIKGTVENNSIIGAAGGEEMRGLAGDDRLTGAGGADSLFGGSGDDVLKGGGGLDRLLGNGGDDTLTGGGRSDFLKGGGGADLIKGGGGADTLNGNGRDDTLDGGRGDDILKGGGGADLFAFSGGRDTVLDFVVGVDRMDASGFDGIDDLVIADTAVGAAVSAGAKTLLLEGVAANALTGDQFIFAGDQSVPDTASVSSATGAVETAPDNDAAGFDAAPGADEHHDQGHDQVHGHKHDHGDGDHHDPNHAHPVFRPYAETDLLL